MPRVSSDTGTLSRLSSDTFVGNTFMSQSATLRNILLPASVNYLSSDLVEIGSSFSLEIPATSSLEVAGYDTQVQANGVGFITMYAGTQAPSGWFLCQGQAVSRTTYAALFAILSTTYGVGDGSTTFTLPNLSGRSPLGVGTASATGATAWTLGTQPTTGAGGEQTHVLSIAELAAHSHQSSTGGVFLTNSAGGITAGAAVGTASGQSNTTTTTGSDTGHNILSPVSVVNFIIKY